MKQKVVIFYAMPYEIVDERTGRVNEGISCTYVHTMELAPVVEDNGAMGIQTVKQSISSEFLNKLVQVPGIYEVDFAMRAVGGKPMMVPVGIEFVSGVKFQEVKEKF